MFAMRIAITCSFAIRSLRPGPPRASEFYDAATNTWGGGRPMGEYDPTPEQIVEWALAPDAGEQDT
jgi:hypothetical protein